MNISSTATTTVRNGNKEVVITVLEGGIWEKEGVSRRYYDITQDNKRNVLSNLYQVLSGTTRDDVVEVCGRVFGYQLGGSCDSKSKRVAAKEAVLDIVNKLIA